MSSFSASAASAGGSSDVAALGEEDLQAAVAQGAISSAQAELLRDLVRKRVHERAVAEGHEERFRFLQGFNDIFLAIGVVLVFAGMFYPAHEQSLVMIAVACVIWSLAELLIRHMRLVLPGILLASFFVVAVYEATPAGPWFPAPARAMPPSNMSNAAPLDLVRFLVGGGTLFVATKAAAATLAAALFFVRFRLPFAVLLLAGGLVACGLMVASYLFVPFALPALQNTIMLVLGLSVFAAAMAYDSSDRERISSRADCAFWLHLLAAPLIVHALVGLASYGSWRTTPTIAAAVVLIILGLAVVAVVIDRRALLVSGLSSLGVVIAYALTVLAGSPKPDRYAFAGTLLVLGALVLTLGLGWLALRRRLVPVLPAAITNHLPPVPQHQ